MRRSCAILDDYQGVAPRFADWSLIADRVEVKTYREHIDDEDELAEALADCEIVVAMRERTPFRAALLRRLPKLKLLVTTGMRNASIDIAAAEAQGVTVCGTAGYSEAPAELTWALILGLARRVTEESAAFRAGGPWQSTVGVDLYGKKLGLIGLGKIGAKVARIGAAFGMEVSAWSQNLTKERAEAEGVQFAGSLKELMSASDFVSVHVVLSDRTRNLVGDGELRAMRPDAYLINTSRAGIVNQPALISALEEGRIAGAGLDVYEVEPLPAEHPYRRLPNVLALPHLGYVTERNYRAYFSDAVEDIEAYLAGAPVRVLSAAARP